MKTDEEIKTLAGHSDAIPKIYIDGFLEGWRKCEKEKLSQILCVNNNNCQCLIKDSFTITDGVTHCCKCGGIINWGKT